MTMLKLLFRRETAIPALSLVFASGVCVALVCARILWTGNVRYSFLIWNLFLAWLPLLLALAVYEKHRNHATLTPGVLGLATAWLLFFPNAPYICTDLVHLTSSFHRHFWIDMVLILSCALTGLVLGFVSLYLMQIVVTRLYGRIAGWTLVGAVAALSGFGIYIGRFLRFNSWDVVFKPFELYRGVGRWLSQPASHSTSLAFPVLFATFLFITYLMLYALTHLNQVHALSPAPQQPPR
jgi:uncharacterized membrane protein